MWRRYRRSNRRHILELLGKMDALLGAMVRVEDAIRALAAPPNPEPRNPYMDQ